MLNITATPDSPLFACAAYRRMADLWQLTNDLMGGTLSMRDAGTKWLPREEAEEPRHYQLRLDRSVLYNGFGDTIEKLSARPFSKPITFKGELPTQLEWLEKNADHSGTNLTQFVHTLFKDGVKYGLAHCIVDYSLVPENATLEDEVVNKWGPYLVRICPDSLFYWRTGPSGLEEIRYKETRCVREGQFGEKCVEYVIQWTTTTVTEYKIEASAVVETTVRPHKHGCIPLFTFYTKRIGFMEAKPPLEDLAWVNVAHWQSYSDQRNILRFARLGIIAMTGISQEEKDQGFVLAANKVIKSTNPDAKIYYVEHSGKAIAIGHQDVSTLEDKMLVLGMQPLFESTGKATATGRAMDESRSQALAQTWVIEFEEFLESMYIYAAKLVKKPLTAFSIIIDKEFSLSMKAGLDVQALLAMRQAGELDRVTFLEEMKRRSVLADTTDISLVIEKAKADGPSKPNPATQAKNAGDRNKQTGAMSDPVVNPAGI